MLEITNLSKRFGGLSAVNHLDLNIPDGQKFGIIGPNGAGKTTLFNLITGFDKPSEGYITFDGKKINGLKPNHIAELGLIRTFQANVLFHQMTVTENIIAACYLHPRSGFWEGLLGLTSVKIKEQCYQEKSRHILDVIGLSQSRNELVGNLPHGYKRALCVGVALAAEPKVLLLDEPTTGMNSEEVEGILKIINNVWESGVTIMLVEHNMEVVNTLCHRVVTLDHGQKIAEGPPEEIRENKQVIEAYLGVED